MEESLVLSDLSQKPTVIEVLNSLDLPMLTGKKVEMALDYPGQQLAVDLYAATEEELDEAIALVRAALKERGIESRPAAELDAEILLRRRVSA